MSQELVSVIMPTYNAGRFLSDSIACVLNQTHKNLELLITDDCSTEEETRKI
ncbi:MAG: glycosyltransferase, partial [Prevotella sp.]|nr:glycosyltransferase [Prevotella sp.]